MKNNLLSFAKHTASTGGISAAIKMAMSEPEIATSIDSVDRDAFFMTVIM